MKMKLAALLAGSSVMALASPALAQDDDNAIVVTGTIIRGVAPAGANVVGFSEEDVQASGASNLNELMATLPQVSGNLYGSTGQGVQGNFNSFVNLPRISLRDLPGSNLGGGMQTLVLVDGHRLISGGIAQVGVDSRVVSPMLVERVEVITDGGSAIYGSDAIAGVINYITRSEYDGVEATGRMSFGQNGYQAWNGGVAGGTAWDTGSVFASLDYATRDAMFGRDFDYIRDYGRNPADLSPLPTGTQCDTATVEEGGASYSPSGTPLSLLETRCDLTGRSGRLSEEWIHNFNAGFTQELTESLRFDLRGLYSDRTTASRSSPYGFTATVSPGNPNYAMGGALPGAGDQTVRFNFSPVYDQGVNKATTSLVAWQVTPSLTWDVGNDWQIRGLVSYGESETTVRNTDLVATRVNDAIAAGTLNPYDVASSDPGALAGVLGTNYQQGWNTLENYRLTADGPLFELPGGMIRTAVGAEYMSNDFSRQLTTTTDPTYPLGARESYEQTVESVFGQLSVPIFGPGNRFFLMESLLLQVSARYDNYNDFGSTVNPMIGVTYEPTDWLTIRGNWGESFQAASPTDILGTTAPTNIAPTLPGNGTLADGSTNTAYIVSLTNSAVQPLEPQTTTNWSVGFDLRPPMIPGLTLSASYYHIELNGRISNVANGSSNALINTVFPNLYYDASELTPAQFQAFRDLTGTLLDDYYVAGEAPRTNLVEAVIDNRRRNIGNNLIEGLDFSARYFHDTDWGSWDASISGTFKLTDDEQASSAAPWINKLEVRDPTAANVGQLNERLRLTASFGVSVDNFRAQATLNRQDGRDNAFYVTGTGATQVAAIPPANAIYQADVDPYLTLDLFFRYNLDNSGWGDWTSDTSLTLNIDNVTNEEPDIVQTGSRNLAGTESSGGYGLFGQNLGRVFTVGISKRF